MSNDKNRRVAISDGDRFGRLKIKPFVHRSRGSHAYWQCDCDCGEVVSVRQDHLLGGRTQSCGCLRREQQTKHGLSQTSEYRSWNLMHFRCSSPKCWMYRYYGGRGITVDPAWDDFEVFLRDMGPKPSPKHSIDRVDPDGPYSPTNCVWSDTFQQANNRRNNRIVVVGDELMTMAQVVKLLGKPYSSVRLILTSGKSIEMPDGVIVRLAKQEDMSKPRRDGVTARPKVKQL